MLCGALQMKPLVWKMAKMDTLYGMEHYKQSKTLKSTCSSCSNFPFWLVWLMQVILSVLFSMTDAIQTYFFPSIVSTLGYDKITTLLLTAPPYALAFFTSLGNSLHSGASNERAFHIAIPLTISMLGNVLCVTLTSTAGRYASMFLMTMGVYSAFNVTLSWVSSTIPRPKVSNFQLSRNRAYTDRHLVKKSSSTCNGQLACQLHTLVHQLSLS